MRDKDMKGYMTQPHPLRTVNLGRGETRNNIEFTHVTLPFESCWPAVMLQLARSFGSFCCRLCGVCRRHLDSLQHRTFSSSKDVQQGWTILLTDQLTKRAAIGDQRIFIDTIVGHGSREVPGIYMAADCSCCWKSFQYFMISLCLH